jgi:lysophospholipase L1-like esterase
VLNVAAYRGDPKGAYWTPYIVGDAMPDLMARFNGIMQEVAGPRTPATSFLASPLTAPWEPADFVDRGHFTRQGGQRMASLIAAHLRELRQAGHLPPPPTP